MDCRQARGLLSLFMDDALDRDTRESLQEHLLECASCRAELDSLQSLVKNVESFGMLKAPENILEKLHARTMGEDTESRLKKLLHLLFFPLHIKIPIQVVSLASVAIILLSLFHAVEPQLQLPSLESASSETKQAQGQIAPQETRQEEEVQKPAPMIEKGSGRPLPLKEERASAQSSAVESYKKAQKPGQAKIDQVVEGASDQPIEVAIVLRSLGKPRATGPSGENVQAPAGFEATGRDSIGTMAAPAPRIAGEAEDKALLVPDKKAMKSFNSQVKEPLGAPARTTTSESPVITTMKDLVESVQGSFIHADYDEQAQIPRVITVRIPGGALNEFFKRLKEIADLKMPTPSTIHPGREDHLVRIHVESGDSPKK